MLLKKVISGGQTGADEAGLVAAQFAGIATGGSAPRGYRTLNGPNPKLGTLFGLREHPSEAYPPRTESNVSDSDATIRFARHFDSRGELCTMKYIRKHGKPHFDVDVDNLPPIEKVVQWLKDCNIVTLNVAGNSESSAPGIYEIVWQYLLKVFRKAAENE
jgi:hypothetical protein